MTSPDFELCHFKRFDICCLSGHMKRKRSRRYHRLHNRHKIWRIHISLSLEFSYLTNFCFIFNKCKISFFPSSILTVYLVSKINCKFHEIFVFELNQKTCLIVFEHRNFLQLKSLLKFKLQGAS